MNAIWAPVSRGGVSNQDRPAAVWTIVSIATWTTLTRMFLDTVSKADGKVNLSS